MTQRKKKVCMYVVCGVFGGGKLGAGGGGGVLVGAWCVVVGAF